MWALPHPPPYNNILNTITYLSKPALPYPHTHTHTHTQKYGLEMVSQLMENGGFRCNHLSISDTAQFSRRALFLDVAHRYMPIDTLQAIIRGLSYSKMNVLNMHFADSGAVRVTTKSYDGIADSFNGFYTPDDISALVAYAKNFGVILVPSVRPPPLLPFLQLHIHLSLLTFACPISPFLHLHTLPSLLYLGKLFTRTHMLKCYSLS